MCFFCTAEIVSVWLIRRQESVSMAVEVAARVSLWEAVEAVAPSW